MNDLFKEFPNTSEREWKNSVQAELKGGNYTEILCREVPEGFQVKPLYSKADVLSSPTLAHKNNWKIVSNFKPENQISYGSLDGIILPLKYVTEFYPTQDELLIIKVENELPKLERPNQNSYLDWDFLSDLAQFGNWNKSKEKTIQKAKTILNKGFKKGLCINISNYQNAGANHAEELALFLLEAKEYVEIFGSDILSQLMTQVAVGSDFFFEVAKLRALRVLWYNFTKEYGKENEIFILSESTIRNKSILDRYNNIIRTTFEATAGILGNSDAVFLHPYDELMIENKNTNHELSFKQQWVLREESFLNNYIDPLKGSYFVEYLTHQLAEKAWELFKKWEKEGGFIACLQKGILQKTINKSHQEEQEAFNNGKLAHIGTSKFPNKKDIHILDQLKPKQKNNGKTLFATIMPQRLSEETESNFE